MSTAVTKIDRLLKAAVEKIAELDPNYQIDVEVIPESGEDLQSLRHHIEASGGRVTGAESKTLTSRMPIGQILRLAASDLVSAIRLIRTHRMHEK